MFSQVEQQNQAQRFTEFEQFRSTRINSSRVNDIHDYYHRRNENIDDYQSDYECNMARTSTTTKKRRTRTFMSPMVSSFRNMFDHYVSPSDNSGQRQSDDVEEEQVPIKEEINESDHESSDEEERRNPDTPEESKSEKSSRKSSLSSSHNKKSSTKSHATTIPSVITSTNDENNDSDESDSSSSCSSSSNNSSSNSSSSSSSSTISSKKKSKRRKDKKKKNKKKKSTKKKSKQNKFDKKVAKYSKALHSAATRFNLPKLEYNQNADKRRNNYCFWVKHLQRITTMFQHLNQVETRSNNKQYKIKSTWNAAFASLLLSYMQGDLLYQLL